jgi:hypothetical protein
MTVAGLVNFVIVLIIVGMVFWLLHYLLTTLPVPEPFRTVGRTVLIVLGVLICILLLLDLIGIGGGLRLPRIAN